MNDNPERGKHGRKEEPSELLAPRPIPASFVKAGAASILLRHAMEAGEECAHLFTALDDAVAVAIPDLKPLGIARMEIAEGERLMLDAKREYAIGDKRRAYLLQMEGHCSWMLMLQRNGYATPTDDDIKRVHAEQVAASRATPSATLEKLSTQGNAR